MKKSFFSVLVCLCALVPSAAAANYWGHPDAWPDVPGSPAAPVAAPNSGQPTPYPSYQNPGHYGSDILPEMVPGTVHSVYMPAMVAARQSADGLNKTVIVHFKKTGVQSAVECSINDGNVSHYFGMVREGAAKGEYSLSPLPDGGYLVSDGRPGAELAQALLRGKWGNWLLSACPAALAATAPKIEIVFRKSFYIEYPDVPGLLFEASVSDDDRAGVFARYHLGLVSAKNGVYTVVPLNGQKIGALVKRINSNRLVKSAAAK